MNLKSNILSLLRSIPNDEDENDLVTIKLESKVIQISFSQLCKYSQLIREEYVISDARDRLSQELLRFQQENLIDINNIIIFFDLFKEEDVIITNDRYKDFYKLSNFFQIKKLIKQLKIYFISHISDIDFIILRFKEEIKQQNNLDKVDFEYKLQFEQFMINKINDCLQNENFQKIPVSFIYKIIEKCEEKEISSDLLFDFIKKSPENHFVLFKFIKFQDLSKEKFEELYELYLNSNKNYFQYLSCNLEYIKTIKMINEKLENDKNLLEINQIQLIEENSLLHKKLIQSENEKNCLQNQIQKLEEKIKKLEDNLNNEKNENYKLESQNIEIENENKNFKILISNLNKDKTELQNQVNEYEHKFQLLQPKYNDLINSNELFSLVFNSLLGDKTEINLKKSVSLLNVLSEKGHCLASYILGLIYVKGEEIEKDFAKSVLYLKNHQNKEMAMD